VQGQPIPLEMVHERASSPWAARRATRPRRAAATAPDGGCAAAARAARADHHGADVLVTGCDNQQEAKSRRQPADDNQLTTAVG
jgi:hypothetical protein